VPASPLSETIPSPLDKIGFIFLILFIFFSYSRVLEFFLTGLRLQLVFSLLGLAAAVVSGRMLGCLRSPITLWLFGLTGCMLVSVPLSAWPGASVGIIMDDWSKSFILFLTIVPLLATTSHVSRVISAAAIGSAVLPILALWIGEYSSGRLQMPAGQYGNPNDLATAIAMGVMLWVAIAANPKSHKLMRIIGVLSMVPLMLVMMKTGSRAALFVLAAGMIVALANFSMMARIKFLAGITVLMLITMPFVSNDLLARFFVIFDGSKSTMDERMEEEAIGSSESRLYLLEESVKMTFRNPLLGVGVGQFATVEAADARTEGRRGIWHGTHNTYTQISSETGFPGFICYVGVLVACWRSLSWVKRMNWSYSHPRKTEIASTVTALKLQLVTLAAAGCFAHFGYLWLVPAMAALVCGLTLAARREFSQLRPAGAAPAARAAQSPGLTGPPRRLIGLHAQARS